MATQSFEKKILDDQGTSYNENTTGQVVIEVEVLSAWNGNQILVDMYFRDDSKESFKKDPGVISINQTINLRTPGCAPLAIPVSPIPSIVYQTTAFHPSDFDISLQLGNQPSSTYANHLISEDIVITPNFTIAEVRKDWIALMKANGVLIVTVNDVLKYTGQDIGSTFFGNFVASNQSRFLDTYSIPKENTLPVIPSAYAHSLLIIDQKYLCGSNVLLRHKIEVFYDAERKKKFNITKI